MIIPTYDSAVPFPEIIKTAYIFMLQFKIGVQGYPFA